MLQVIVSMQTPGFTRHDMGTINAELPQSQILSIFLFSRS